MSTYRFKAKLWRFQGNAAWYFVTVPKTESADIKSKIKVKRGFGSVRVEVLVGTTSWTTSLFPDSRSGTYLLPVKKKVRQSEGFDEGDTIALKLTILA